MKTLFRYLVIGVLAIIQTSWAAATFTLTSPSTTKIMVAWSGSATAFNITYGTTEASQTYHGSFPAANGSTVITGLTAGTKYMINAINMINESMIIYSGSKYTKPEAPPNFVISPGTDKTTALTVTWIPLILNPTTDTAYFIKYQTATGPSQETPEFFSPPKSITGLTPGETYTITMWAKITNVGDTETSVETTPQTLTTNPSEVTTFDKAGITVEGVTLTWSHGTGVRSYYVLTTTKLEVQLQNNGNISSSDTNITITGLTPGTQYSFTIKAVSGVKESSPMTKTITTENLAQVKHFRVASVTTNSVTLEWSKASDSPNLTYTITYGNEVNSFISVPNISLAVILHPIGSLSPGTVYTFTIVSVLRGAEGVKSTIQNNTIPAMVDGIKVLSFDTTTVIVSWISKSHLSYEVKYKTEELPFITSSCQTSGCAVSVSVENSGLIITVEVAAILSGRKGSSGTALGNTKPAAPGFLTEDNRTIDTLNVSWGSVANIDNYYATITPISGNQSPLNTTLPKAGFTGLTPGQQYTVTVVSQVNNVNNNMEKISSDVISKDFRTNPLPVTSAIVDHRTTNSLGFSWDPPNINVEIQNYLVTFSSIVQVVNNNTIRFNNLTAGTLYTISIIVQVGIANINLTASDSFGLNTYTKPEAPLLNPITGDETSITVAWPSITADFTAYNISIYSKDCNTNINRPSETVSKNVTQKVYHNLDAGTTFCVKFMTYISHLGATIESDIQEQKGTTKPKSPSSLNVADKMTDSLNLMWNAPNQTSVISGYNVSAFTVQNEVPEQSHNTTQLNLALTSLTPGQNYTITIKAYIMDHNIQKLYSMPINQMVTMIPTKPGSVNVSEIGPAYLKVIWTSPANVFTGFKICWKKSTSQGEFSCKNIFRTSTEGTIDNLDRGTQYIIQVKTVSGSETSAARDVTSTTFPTGTSLDLVSTTSTSIEVGWNVPNDTFSYFNLHIDPNDGQLMLPLKFVKGATPGQNFTNLKPGQTYNMTISVVSSGAQTQNSREFTTKPSIVTSLVLTTINTSGITVAWTADVNSIQNSFEITYNGVTGSEVSGSVSVSSLDSTKIIDGLNPGHKYSISVNAISNNVAGDKFTKEQITEPASVTSFTITEVDSSDTSLKLSWVSPSKSFQEHYEVQYKGTFQSNSWSSSRLKQTLEHTENNLLPGDKYNFSVRAVVGDLKGRAVYNTSVLKPLSPTPMWQPLQTTKSVKFNWTYESNKYHAEKFYLQLYGKDSANLVKSDKVDTTKLEYIFDQLTSGRTYTLKIYGETYDDIRSRSHGLVDATVKPSIDTNLTELSTTTDTIEISYTEVIGVFDQYRFSINNDNSDVKVKNKNSPQTTVKFTSLAASTLYTIKARTTSGILNSDPTSISVLTNPVPPTITCSEQPTDIIVTVQNPSDMTYRIVCEKQDQSDCGGFNNARDNNRVLQFFFRNLEPYHFFTFTVHEEVKIKDTTITKLSKNTVKRCQTKEAAPGIMDAFNITNLVSHPFQVDLSWEVPPTPNGVILGFWISYNGSHPSYPAASEIYLHIPSNNTFTQQIDNLLAGYTYDFKMWSYNGAGNSTQKKILRKTLEVAAPVIPSKHMSRAKPQTGLTMPTSAEITFTNVFSNQNGMIVGYSLFVIPIKDVNQMPSDRALAEAGTWAGQVGVDPQGIYIGISKCKNFFTEGDNCLTKLRNKRQSPSSPSFSPSLSQITVMVGKDDTCQKSSTNIFCNGLLRPNSMYRFILRAYNEKNEFTDAPITDPITTPPKPVDVLLIVLIVIFVSLLIFGIVAIIILMVCLRKRGMICSVKLDTKPSFKMISVDTNRPVKISEFSAHVTNMAKDSDFLFAEEYEELKPVGRDQTCDASEAPPNRPKNRFTNILPYDNTRVKLLPSEDEEGSEYINANWMPGYNSRREFICTQGALPSTTDDFWRMVWEQNCRAIVMLTKCVEKGREKCHHYWPVDTEPMFYGDVQVEILNESKTPEWVVTEFNISKGDITRRLTHFHYIAWPDFGVPEKPQSLLSFIRMVRLRVHNHESGPIVVHCSAGVGRSGTFIVLDRLMQHVESGTAETIDVYGTVFEMRKFRNWMVQTEQQYICIHKCLRCVLEQEEFEDAYPSGEDNRAYEEPIDEGIGMPNGQ